ncbi:transketolase family protein [Anaerotruncus rubiinfantis]|uniref:transketolase family protein n=1 Tax=Anaerotruncus rubiinfantis TaxID=1720200 RepID=UPI0034A24B93
MDKALRTAYGEALIELAQKNDQVVVLDADLGHATMTHLFTEKFPNRFFNFGIAEANMTCAAAGMAHCGLIPFASTFAIFGAGRAYEMVRNSVAYSKANVKIACTHPGISVGEDGGSHEAIEDIALMRVVPGMTVLVPCDAIETRKAVFAAAEIEGPVYLRISRQPSPNVTAIDTPFVPGKATVLREGRDVCIMAIGLLVAPALEAAEKLIEMGISAEVVNMSSIKPIDRSYILEANRRFRGIVTAEEHSVIGGLGSAVAEVLAGNVGANFAMVGVEDCFGKSGTPHALFMQYGLTAENIIQKCVQTVKG